MRWGIEALILVLLMVALSLWLSRHMLDSGTPLPDAPVEFLNPDDNPAPHGLTLHQAIQASQRSYQQPVTLVYAFAPWCSICKVSMPGLDMALDDQTQLIAIAMDWQDKSEVAEMVESIDFQHPVVLDHNALRESLRIDGYPSYYLVDANGQIRFADRGLTTPVGLWLRIKLMRLQDWLG